MRYKTRILHSGADRDPYTGAASIPIYQVSTFIQDGKAAKEGYMYSRARNPTREALESTIAALEEGATGLAFASGMAAISSAFLLFRPGDHIVVPADVYGGTYRSLTTLFAQWGLTHTFVDMTDHDALVGAIKKETRALFVETPSNPLLKITDLRFVAALGKERGLTTIVDNTFMTPFLQRPLQFGCDIVVHSATKFLGGHSDVIAGLAVTGSSELGERLKQIQISFGAIAGPQDSWLLLRGIKTLGARMEIQQRTAENLAAWLSKEKDVLGVWYPGLESHPGRQIHMGQSDGPGAVLSFEVPGGSFVTRFLDALDISLFAVSLGGVETIISYPSRMSHSAMPEAERLKRGITDGLVRLSPGLEDPEDLKEDISRALHHAAQ